MMDREKRQEMLEEIKGSKKTRIFSATLLGTALIRHFFFTPKGWKSLQKPEFWNFPFRTELRKGLLEDAIIQNPLYVPNEQEGGLKYEDALSGRWVAYDFHRERIFGRANPLKKGKFHSFILDDIKDNEGNTQTPTELFQLFDMYHFFHAERPSIDYLIEQEIIEPKTYGEAYQKAGQYETYAHALDIHELKDKKVYQVTPKGNTLLFLAGDGGDTKKHKQPEQEAALGEFVY